jgi:hypothetical protein
MHLNKSGSGMSLKTACGRNILRTPMSTDWENFKMESSIYRCIKCNASKQFELNTKADAKKANPFNYNAPYNPQFLGAQPAQADQDY